MSHSDSPRLLFISPVPPNRTGNGLAMRAAAMLEALSERFRIHLFAPGPVSPALAAVCAGGCPLPSPRYDRLARALRGRRASPPEWCRPSRRTVRRVLSHTEGMRFDHVHVFRLYMMPLAEAVCRKRAAPHARIHLDLDDIESDSRVRMARFADSPRDRLRFERDAAFYAEQEAAWLPRCDRVYVCGGEDRERLAERGLDAVSIVPNTVETGEEPPPPPGEAPFTFLFVGNLNHFPNIDGLRYLADDLLPELREAAPGPFRILIAGSGRRSMLPPELLRRPEVEWLGHVEDLRAVYQQAHATLAPIRCGGGTRIKILESFAMGRPVVSTPAGAHGLEVEHGIELLLASGPDAFARACADLMSSPDLRRRLAERGRSWVLEQASPSRLRRDLEQTLSAGSCV